MNSELIVLTIQDVLVSNIDIKKIHRLCYRWESIGLGIYLSSYNSLVVNVGIIVTFHL